MSRRALGAMAFSGIVLVALSSSCAIFDIPASTCDPKGITAKLTSTSAPDPKCAGCLEGQCCDDIGGCQDEEGCAPAVSAMHLCVLERGGSAAAEADCAPLLGKGARPRKTYQCMRDRCGDDCSLPSCVVDTAASLVVNAACDSCFTGACCRELNTCFQNRTCKLIVECVTSECVSEFADVLELAASIAGLSELATKAACTTDTSPPAALGQGPGACFKRCFDRLAEGDQSGVIDPSRGGSCLSQKLLGCAVNARCGDKCRISADSGADAP